MEQGNLLSPFIVFAVTLFPLLGLLSILKDTEKELHQEKAIKSILEERENIAKELHDGIAQSLFLLAIKVDKFSKKMKALESPEYSNVKQTLEHIQENVRKSIDNLKQPSSTTPFLLSEKLEQLVWLPEGYGIKMKLEWGIKESSLLLSEKITLFACLNEAITNVIKHAEASHISVIGKETHLGWKVVVEDNGIGIKKADLDYATGYGLQIMHDRITNMNWHLHIYEKDNGSIIEIRKGD